MQDSNLIIDKRQIKHLIQKKPAPPNLKAQLKLHKADIPIRPVINNRTAPAYKLAKYLNKILSQHNTLHNLTCSASVRFLCLVTTIQKLICS